MPIIYAKGETLIRHDTEEDGLDVVCIHVQDGDTFIELQERFASWMRENSSKRVMLHIVMYGDMPPPKLLVVVQMIQKLMELRTVIRKHVIGTCLILLPPEDTPGCGRTSSAFSMHKFLGDTFLRMYKPASPLEVHTSLEGAERFKCKVRALARARLDRASRGEGSEGTPSDDSASSSPEASPDPTAWA